MLDNLGHHEGTVAPAFLHTMGAGKAQDFLSKLPLRMGRVVRVHSPGEPTNRSGLFFEYDVVVEEGSENSPATRTMLPHCWMVSDFGGAADFSRWTPRVLETDRQNTADFGLGSRVLVLCINASSFAGVIIGGIQHGGGEKDATDKGHHAVWQFNGVRREVDKDGQLLYSFKGATDAKGTSLNLNGGSAFQLLKDGSFKAFTSGENQRFHLDHATKRVDLLASSDFRAVSGGTFTWQAAGNWSHTVGGSANIVVTASIDMTSQSGGVNILAPVGLVKTSSLGVHLGLATNAMMLGTVYRASEASLHATELAAWTGAAAGFGADAAAWAAMAPFAITLDPTGTLTSFCAAAASASAAAAVTSGAAASALGAFEAGSPTYLSLKNLLD